MDEISRTLAGGMLLDQLRGKDGDKALALELIAQGADVNIKDDSNMTALHWALLKSADDIARALIAAGADLTVEALPERATALHYATQHCAPMDIIAALLERGAEVDAMSGAIRPLNWAVYNGYAAAVDLLCRHGARLDIADSAGLLPLQRAMHQQQTASVKALLRNGAAALMKAEDLQGVRFEKASPEIQELMRNAYDDAQAARAKIMESIDQKQDELRNKARKSDKYRL